jgi:hypothetical protein
MIASRLSGAYGTSIPCESSSARLEAATPMTTSAFGLAFSARSLAVMTPVESCTHLIAMLGFCLLNPASYALTWSSSSAV